MILLTRQGKCNQCGACCGLGADNPWPKNHLDMHMDWQYSAWLTSFPMIVLLGIVAGENGKVEVATERGVTVIDGQEFPYVWHNGQPCQDLKPGSKTPKPTTRCPFLLDGDDGTHPCGLIGTRHENCYLVSCSGNNERDRGVPPNKYSQENIDQWMIDYPDCSYTWE